MWWLAIIGALLIALVAYKLLGLRKASGKQRAEFLKHYQSMVENFRRLEQAADFDDRIKYMSLIVRDCSKASYLFPQDHPQTRILKEIVEACDAERVRLTLRQAVEVSEESMGAAASTDSFQNKIRNARHAFNILKICSRLLFPHENITNAMRLADRYVDTFSTRIESEAERERLLAQGRAIMADFYRVLDLIKAEARRAEQHPLALDELRRKIQLVGNGGVRS